MKAKLGLLAVGAVGTALVLMSLLSTESRTARRAPQMDSGGGKGDGRRDMLLRSPRAGAPDPTSIRNDLAPQVDKGTMALVAPEAMREGETATVILKIDSALGALQLRVLASADADGGVQTASIPMSDRMLARLTGPGFSIPAVAEETQVVTPGKLVTWEWHVTALTAGKQRLTVTVWKPVPGSAPREAAALEELGRAHADVAVGKPLWMVYAGIAGAIAALGVAIAIAVRRKGKFAK